jgi:hypothetical protein
MLLPQPGGGSPVDESIDSVVDIVIVGSVIVVVGSIVVLDIDADIDTSDVVVPVVLASVPASVPVASHGPDGASGRQPLFSEMHALQYAISCCARQYAPGSAWFAQ